MDKNSNKPFYKDLFGQKNNTQQVFQSTRTNTPSSFGKKINIKIILISLGTILFLCIVIYIIICAVHYSKITCYQKKTFLEYITDFSNNSDVLN